MLGGVIDRGGRRVAWVERHQFASDGWVSVWLNLSGDGTVRLPLITGWEHQEPKPRVSVKLAPDRDDKVTGVEFAQFFGYPQESVILLYTWSGVGMCLARLTLSAPGLHGVQTHWVELGGRAAVVVTGEGRFGDSTLFYSHESYIDDDALMYGLRLPELAPQVPIPVPRRSRWAEYTVPRLEAGPAGTVRWTEQWARGEGKWQARRSTVLRLPGSRQEGFADDPSTVWDRLRAALAAGAPPDGPDILIGAVAVPFWDPTGPVSPGRGKQAWETARGPWWFPAAWYRYLRAPEPDGGAGRQAEAEVWLRWLRSLHRRGRMDDRRRSHTGWDPSWSREEGIARFALIHVRRQAGALAAACRAGEVPVLGDFGRWRKPPVLIAAPPGFARAWRELPARFRVT